MRIVGAGHAVFALTMVGVGLLGLAQGDFVQIWQPVPKALPGREVAIRVCAVVSLACGAGLLWRRTAAPAALVLFFYLLLWMLLFKVRFIFRLHHHRRTVGQVCHFRGTDRRLGGG
jgi:uncharacterized membrane protein